MLPVILGILPLPCIFIMEVAGFVIKNEEDSQRKGVYLATQQDTGTSLERVTNIFLVNLSVADLLVTLLCMPVQAGKAFTLVWFYGELMCTLVNYLQGVAVAASVFTLAAMSVDRYMAIAQFMRATRPPGRRSAVVLLAMLWVVALTIFSPLLVVAVLKSEKIPIIKTSLNGSVYEDVTFDFCTEEWQEHSMRRELFGIFSFVLVYAIPGSIMVMAYSLMGRRLCSVRPPFDLSEGSASTQQGARLVRERKRVALILLLLAVLFAVCWLPYNILQLLLDTNSITNASVSAILPYALLLGHANSAINPIVYCLMTRNFRRSVKKLCCSRETDINSTNQYGHNMQNLRGRMFYKTSLQKTYTTNTRRTTVSSPRNGVAYRTVCFNSNNNLNNNVNNIAADAFRPRDNVLQCCKDGTM